jgi:hypothetical protein
VSNTITNVLPKILAQGLMALRQQAMLPRLVNNSYSEEASRRGNVINIPIPSALSVRSITPAVTQAANVDFNPTVALVTLDYWKESVFQFSDSDAVSVMEGTAAMEASEAVKALGNDVDPYIAGKHTGLFTALGNAGTTPFSTVGEAGDIRKMLNKTLAPMDDRRVLLDPDAEAAALKLSNVLQFDQRGDQGGIIRGSIGTKFGMDWYMDQNLSAITYTPGTAWITGWTFDGSNAAGVSTAAVVFTNSGTVKVGDIFSLTAGGLGYAVTAATTAVTSTTMSISFYPPLRQAVATAAVLVIGGSGTTAYTVNLAFHRDCFAWASRPLGSIAGRGNEIVSAVDPVSGIALRLEVSRQYRQETLAWDILGGANVIRPELGLKIKG